MIWYQKQMKNLTFLYKYMLVWNKLLMQNEIIIDNKKQRKSVREKKDRVLVNLRRERRIRLREKNRQKPKHNSLVAQKRKVKYV